MATDTTYLIIGGNGKTGRRVAQRLSDRGTVTRIASRSSTTRFDWHDESTWEHAVVGADAAYLTYSPDLAFPGAAEQIAGFAKLAADRGVRRLVLLSGRGEAEAERAEQGVTGTGAEWTVLRGAWFAQNFSEHFLLDSVLAGLIALPAGEVTEPFIDIGDLADVAVAALTEPGHHGRTYELTGPRLLSFGDVAAELSDATGRPIEYLPVTARQFADGATQQGVPPEQIAPLTDLFTRILDGRNSQVTDDVRRVLGRAPTDFRDYARTTAADGAWNVRPRPESHRS